jgi:hypothetical protein
MDTIPRRYEHNVNTNIYKQTDKLAVNNCQQEVNTFNLNYSNSGDEIRTTVISVVGYSRAALNVMY